MRRTFVCLAAALLFCIASLVFSAPVAVRTVKASDLQEKCDDCSIRNFRQFEQCVAVHGEAEPRCYDQYNEGVVHCYRNFCEQ